MAKNKSDTILRIGRYSNESHPIGSVNVRIENDRAEVKLRFGLTDLEHGVLLAGLFVSDDKDKRRERVLTAMSNLSAKIGDWQREWLTYTLLGNTEIEKMPVAKFLSWAETNSATFDLWLSVPAVRDKIRQIKDMTDRPLKRRLSRIFVGLLDHRPIRLPDDCVIYRRITGLEIAFRDLRERLMAANNRAAVWLALQANSPAAAEALERYKLQQLWFVGNHPLTSLQMSKDFVAAELGSTRSTIAKVYGRETTRRKRMRQPDQKPIDRVLRIALRAVEPARKKK